MLLLDIAKAFNCIDHLLLHVFKKMNSVGLSDRVIAWFKSYLTRCQVIKYGEELSTSISFPAGHGIAQGTVLRQLIFIFCK